MIRLNSERGPVALESWEEVEAIPGYTAQINPKHESLKEIIGAYALPDPVPCGISSCRTPHNKGYVVVAGSGLVTNIGNVCGKKAFGIEFQQKARLYRRMAREMERRETITTFKNREAELGERIKSLTDGLKAGRWLQRRRRLDGLPDKIARQLRDMARHDESILKKPRLASKSEIDTIEASTGKPAPKPYYIDEAVGELDAIRALSDQSDPRELITIAIDSFHHRLVAANPDTMPAADLKTLSKECGEIDRRIEAAERAIAYGRRFFTSGNLRPLLLLAESSSEIKQVKQFLNQIESD